jgi:hypothetical protein
MIAHLICVLSNLPNDTSALQSSISALEREIATLDKSSGSWEWPLAGCTLVVAIGVAMEIFVVQRDHKEEMEEWHVCELVPKRPSLTKVCLEIASVVLVTAGILGELGIGLWISHINGDLRSKNSQLRTNSDQLVALLTKETQDEISARVKLQARVAWRRLSKEQQSVLTDHLKQFSGMRVGVSYLGGNPEASDFAKDIAAALQAAQWNIYPLEPFSLFGGFGGGVYPLHPSTGVNVSTTGERGSNASEALQHDLCSMGFDTAITPKPPVTKTDGTEPKIDVVVLVVARPIAPQRAATLTINAKTRDCTASE